MLMALCLASLLSLAGQTSTQRAQPVQSSGATWSVYLSLPKSFHLCSADLKRLGAAASRSLGVDLGADGGVRADQHALVALDAERPRPRREFPGRCCASPTARCRWEGAVDGKAADRQIVAVAGDHGRQTFCTKSGAWAGTGGGSSTLAGGLGRNLDSIEIGQGADRPPRSSSAPRLRPSCRRSS